MLLALNDQGGTDLTVRAQKRSGSSFCFARFLPLWAKTKCFDSPRFKHYDHSIRLRDCAFSSAKSDSARGLMVLDRGLYVCASLAAGVSNCSRTRSHPFASLARN
jgi:hypothetical protein